MDTTPSDAVSATNASSERADELVPSDTLQVPIDFDPRDVRKALASAEDLKQEANDHFRAKRWDEAIALYRSALGHLPRRPRPPNSTTETDSNDGHIDASRLENDSNSKAPAQEAAQGQRSPPSELEADCAKARAILNANISACYAKLGEHKEVVSACTEALKDDPNYIKALQRRAAANEQINSCDQLATEDIAMSDYKRLLELLPPTSPDVVSVRRTLATFPPRVESAQKRETAEMLDKLKGLGNSLLGNFGLSTNNFQFAPNGQGGYSMNFVQNPE